MRAYRLASDPLKRPVPFVCTGEVIVFMCVVVYGFCVNALSNAVWHSWAFRWRCGHMHNILVPLCQYKVRGKPSWKVYLKIENLSLCSSYEAENCGPRFSAFSIWIQTFAPRHIPLITKGTQMYCVSTAAVMGLVLVRVLYHAPPTFLCVLCQHRYEC